MEALYAAGIPAVLGQIEIVKRFIPDRYHRWLPIAAVLLGVVWACMLPGRVAVERLCIGSAIGLGAAGAFDGTRALSKKQKVQ